MYPDQTAPKQQSDQGLHCFPLIQPYKANRVGNGLNKDRMVNTK